MGATGEKVGEIPGQTWGGMRVWEGGREAILASSPSPHAGPGRTPCASGWESPVGRGWCKDGTGWEETGLG